jgi:hypothetical protein
MMTSRMYIVLLLRRSTKRERRRRRAVGVVSLFALRALSFSAFAARLSARQQEEGHGHAGEGVPGRMNAGDERKRTKKRESLPALSV